MNYTVLIEQDEDGVYIAKVPDISGCDISEKQLSKLWGA
ncbi:type II toxin-antitoxin system HicB family antitoxin [Methanosarcina sp.]|nr:type II toxin-antitoxin system HicB family antitoxin [Methanosarcina sp.]MDY9924865.1 type II toxin-antitoxin system HicB family antitoxin [Methanosarcina sp.]